MRILLVTLKALESNSSVTISNLGIVRGLVDCGCEVDLLMPSINKTLKEYDPSLHDLEGVNIIRIKSNIMYERLVTGKQSKARKVLISILRKVSYKLNLYDNTVGILKYANVKVLNHKNYDYVISTSDPKTSHVFVRNLISQGLKYNKWIQHWGDPMSLDITRESIYPLVYIKKKEKQIFSCADKIVYVSPLTASVQKELFPKFKDRMCFVPLPYVKEKLYKPVNNERITLDYFGNYNSRTRNIIPLYEFVRRNDQYKLVIAGESDQILEKTENVEVLPRIRQEQVEEFEENCDILVCLCNNSGTQIPGKLYYYAATNKPVLVILDGECKAEIRKYLSAYARFVMCDNNTESIENEILKIFKENNSYNPAKVFSPREIAKKLLD